MAVDTQELEAKVQQMYREVALHPDAGFHFELGRGLAESVGYDPARLDLVPVDAVASFAGVGHFFDLADPRPGETLLDLGSGSGMDVFYAATLVGAAGQVIGVDFTREQLAKARRLAAGHGTAATVEFREGRLDDLPVDDASVDCVISNGVINLCPDKALVFAEAARVLRPEGRLALADIVTDVPLAEGIVCNADLWAACIGGAAQVDDYVAAIEKSGLVVEVMRRNRYGFLSAGAQGAEKTYGVRSVSLLAHKPVQP
ncbi:methyltransferase domain-containing protein [Nocardioides sp. NPDC057772]|uniref:methyltransferase domain-containing protein n=1 Tax=Nocardioides sp. NPDC057772 TaxID=3346245 RepID=UPI0036724B4D